MNIGGGSHGYAIRRRAALANPIRADRGVPFHLRPVIHRPGPDLGHLRHQVPSKPQRGRRQCHALLGAHLHRHLRHRRGHGHHHGVLIRHELGRLLALRGRHLRRAACRRGPVRVLPGIGVPGRAAVRAQQGVQPVLHRVRVAGVGRFVLERAVDPHRELVDADARRR